jgi:hypothetical protein
VYTFLKGKPEMVSFLFLKDFCFQLPLLVSKKLLIDQLPEPSLASVLHLVIITVIHGNQDTAFCLHFASFITNNDAFCAAFFM